MKQTFGKILKDLRLEKGMSQVELAKNLNVGKSIISVWEKDQAEPKLSNLVAISQFFGCTIEYLAGMED
ncbi:MAG: helix-turn-helix transcriptional regulator [Clostridiales bacterium]|nr:helix-turn-helix transcriptional regulator [Candidatus Apopatousia equi]